MAGIFLIFGETFDLSKQINEILTWGSCPTVPTPKPISGLNQNFFEIYTHYLKLLSMVIYKKVLQIWNWRK